MSVFFNRFPLLPTILFVFHDHHRLFAFMLSLLISTRFVPMCHSSTVALAVEMLANACLRKYLGPELATGQCVYAADRVALHRTQYATGQRVYTADRLALHRKQYECALHTRLECCAI